MGRGPVELEPVGGCIGATGGCIGATGCGGGGGGAMHAVGLELQLELELEIQLLPVTCAVGSPKPLSMLPPHIHSPESKLSSDSLPTCSTMIGICGFGGLKGCAREMGHLIVWMAEMIRANFRPHVAARTFARTWANDKLSLIR